MLALGREHDDNVIQLTDSSKVLFGFETANPTKRRGRFIIGQVSDMLTTADASLRWRGRPFTRRESRAQLDLGLHRYDHDHAVDWQQYELALTQELTTSRRQPLALDVFVNRIPQYYLGEATNVEASVAAGRNIRQSLTFAQTGCGIRLRQDLLRGRVSFAAGFERLRREYNPNFAERTNHNDQWRLQAEVMPFKRWAGAARVLWLKGDLRARGNIPDSLDIVEHDISYHHDGIGAGLTLPWGRGDWRGRLDASFTPEVREYPTTDKLDILRFARENHRREVRVRVTERVWGPVEAVATWSKLTSRAAFHGGIAFPANQTNFNQEQFGVVLRARWELALH